MRTFEIYNLRFEIPLKTVLVIVLIALPLIAKATVKLETADWNKAGLEKWTDKDDWAVIPAPKPSEITKHLKPTPKLLTGSISSETSADTLSDEISPLFSGEDADEFDIDRATFVSELESSNWIDTHMWNVGLNDPVHGIDSNYLTIPEPHTMIMLIAAGAATALSYRKRRNHSPSKTSL